MRNIIIAAVAALSLSSAAFGKEIARLSFNRGNVDGFAVAELSLDDLGDVSITSTPVYQPLGTAPTIVSKALPAEVFQALKQDVIALANAEIVTTHVGIVCMMMPLPGSSHDLLVARAYDYQSETFAKDATLVYSRAGCWSHTRVAPKESYAVEQAQKLSAELEILGLQLLND